VSRALILAALLAGCADTHYAWLGSDEQDAGRSPWPPGLKSCEDIAEVARGIRERSQDGGFDSSCELFPLRQGCPALEFTLAVQLCGSDILKLTGVPSASDAGDR
jgi:hypothetical protein